MKRALLVLSLLVLLLPLQGAKPSLTATIPPLTLWLSEIAGPQMEITTLIKPGSSPHTFALTVSAAASIHRSKGMVLVGADLEPWLKEMGNPKKSPIPLFVLADYSAPLIGPAHHPNPHLWLSPRRMAKATPALGEFLARLDPTNAPLYRRRAGEVKKRLEELDKSFAQQSRSLSRRAVVVHHPSWNYLLEDYGIRVAATVERNDEETPSPRRIQEILGIMKREKVDVILTEPNVSAPWGRMLSQEARGREVVLDPLAFTPDLKSYTHFLEKNFLLLKDVLR